MDYNGGEHSNLVTQEFSSHHWAAPFFLYINKVLNEKVFMFSGIIEEFATVVAIQKTEIILILHCVARLSTS